MFRTAAAETGEIEQGSSRGTSADLIPLSHLALDLDTPAVGWAAYLTGRGIEIVLDSVGRKAISAADARQLFDEHRDNEARQAQMREAAERAAEAADRQRRAQIWQGIPADLMPAGAAPAAVMLQLDKESRPKRLTPLEE